jgi:hypothetical protein
MGGAFLVPGSTELVFSTVQVDLGSVPPGLTLSGASSKMGETVVYA